MASPGTLVLAHEKPNQRPSWAFHGIEAWYVGPSLDHYRLISAYVPSTQQLRVCDTVQYFPHARESIFLVKKRPHSKTVRLFCESKANGISKKQTG